MRANCVIAVGINYKAVSSNGSLKMVTAAGTALVLELD